MGAHIAVCRTRALHDSNSWPLSLEFSLAAILPSDPCDLRGGGAADGIAVNHCTHDRGCPGHSDGNGRVHASDSWFLHSSAWLDFSWIGRSLAFGGIRRRPFQI